MLLLIFWERTPHQWILLVISPGEFEPHLIHRSSGPSESTIRSASRSVHHFCRAHKHDQRADRHTDHATPSVATGRM